MSMDTVHKAPLTFGTSGTQTSVADTTTSTTNRHPGPKGKYSLQLTVIATGTSGVGGTCILQGSNDGSAWIAIGSATATATQAGTGTTYVGAAIAVADTPFAAIRAATVVVTGTGAASLTLGE